MFVLLLNFWSNYYINAYVYLNFCVSHSSIFDLIYSKKLSPIYVIFQFLFSTDLWIWKKEKETEKKETAVRRARSAFLLYIFWSVWLIWSDLIWSVYLSDLICISIWSDLSDWSDISDLIWSVYLWSDLRCAAGTIYYIIYLIWSVWLIWSDLIWSVYIYIWSDLSD